MFVPVLLVTLEITVNLSTFNFTGYSVSMKETKSLRDQYIVPMVFGSVIYYLKCRNPGRVRELEVGEKSCKVRVYIGRGKLIGKYLLWFC